MNREIFIGDVQGCLGPLERLLEVLRFDPAADRLRLVGDLVNRGGESLATLRLLRSLGESAMSVLGNHDLHLIAYAYGLTPASRANPEFDAVVEAEDGEDLIAWLCGQPLAWLCRQRRIALVHAGIDPRWEPGDLADCATEVERALADEPEQFLRHMYGDRPERWQPHLDAPERLRTITNVLTRMRFCDAEGRLALTAKGAVDEAPEGFRPWFELLHPAWRDWRIVFGHWSQLGLYETDGVTCLDSGCVWRGRLSALVVDEDRQRVVSVDCEHG